MQNAGAMVSGESTASAGSPAAPPVAVSPSVPPAPNRARAVARAGNLCGVFMLMAAVVATCLHGEVATAVPTAATYAAASLALLALSVFVANHLLLRGRVGSEVRRGNVAAGIAAAAHAVAGGILVASCLGTDNAAALPVEVGFFVLCQATLIALVLGFRSLTTYADDQEIAGENPAAAVSYAGVTVALALIVGHAADGSFVGWGESLRAYGLALALALALYPVRQLVVTRLLLGLPPALRGGALDHAIGRDRDVGAAVVEALAYLATALLVTGLS